MRPNGFVVSFVGYEKFISHVLVHFSELKVCQKCQRHRRGRTEGQTAGSQKKGKKLWVLRIAPNFTPLQFDPEEASKTLEERQKEHHKKQKKEQEARLQRDVVSFGQGVPEGEFVESSDEEVCPPQEAVTVDDCEFPAFFFIVTYSLHA